MMKLKFKDIVNFSRKSFDKLAERVDEIDWQNYLNCVDDLSLIPYEVINGRICVREDIIHSEIIDILERYMQGVAPIGGMWFVNNGYAIDYKYINMRDEYTPLGVSRYITYDLISYYSRYYIPPQGYDEYVLCDAITHSRVHKIRVCYKWSNRSGLDILKLRHKLKI